VWEYFPQDHFQKLDIFELVPLRSAAQKSPCLRLEALRAGRLRESDKLASFVLGTCRMTVLDLRRNRQRKERLLEQFGADLLAPVPPSMPYLDREQLASCVQKLKERERAVILMTFYDEQTGADVARFLGASEANVRVIRHRAIHQLRDCMGGAA